MEKVGIENPLRKLFMYNQKSKGRRNIVDESR